MPSQSRLVQTPRTTNPRPHDRTTQRIVEAIVIEKTHLPDDPLVLFEAWYQEARAAAVPLCHAVCLATTSDEGLPSARMVLFQGIAKGRLTFFTDYRSRKARELESKRVAAMVFYWHAQDRQVRIEGTVERLSAESSDRYFMSRPRGSRVSAWASSQSATIESRSVLERRWAEVEVQFRDADVVRPPHWGGYGLLPERFEFWQGRDDRLHDRVAFTTTLDGWDRVLLQP